MSLFNEQPKIGQELLDVPMGDMIRQMAFAIAEAQIKLDSNSMEVAQMMGGLQTITEEINGEEVVTFEDSRVFFGQEKVTLTGAVELYNSTNDKELKATIKNKLDGNWDYANLTTDNSLTTYAILEAKTDSSFRISNQIYKVVVSPNVTEYYAYKGDGTTKLYEKVSESDILIKKKSGAVEKTFFIPARVSMLELGFSPTFYQFVDTMIEVKISIKYTQEGSYTRTTNTNRRSSSFKAGAMFIPGLGGGIAAGRSVTTTQVNATYSQKYSYSAEGSSFLRTKLVPIPPPAILEERIRAQMELAKEQNKTT
ncbi:hypothetical protein [Flavobacterium cheongpyeongense]|uniref:hypothetical protein n=1 Tax=Flavobacterium cheongpyeongense TaxID=2212651 RepID=UPI0018AD350E|nr:hypothetical protein [Flavobacterium cheongpyeongense]